MSTMNSLLAGVAGAAIASGAWYAASGNNEVAPSPTPAPMQAVSPIEDTTETCEVRKQHAITYAEAQTLVTKYLAPSNNFKLTVDGTTPLKGWYMEKCIIEDLFRLYPNADGLQIYVGLQLNPETNLPENKLVWMATQEVNDGGNMVRENCISEIQTVIDQSQSCPLFCPTKNPLP